VTVPGLISSPPQLTDVNLHPLLARLVVAAVALGTAGALLVGLGGALSSPAALVTVVLAVVVVAAAGVAGVRAAGATSTRYW
jgi:hypothetical protein